ncbi:uncharacterized protein RAG0_11915 [Rhynchosporium agropyri]|uniref:DUF1750-domain-containing protein n=1 Tax=Rhynchosporium agropyri TaxID=914238 RepID=A0A1E1L6F0_9HELO|nr:uncharacterized protein RAG0_11915 [Rhynchosporium agropyri]
MQEPSQGIQRELLGHVHLVSSYRFPQLAQIHPDKVAEYLLGAPKIARDQATFYWTYLDRPADGTVLLVWQSPQLGSEFPSDGYIWSPGESPFAIEVQGGYTLEMYQQKTGYAPNEPIATHSRRRYRLLSSRSNPNAPSPDPSLWIIHYTQCEAHDRVPSNVIPVDMRVREIMNTRGYLQSHGQIVQKEFMLHDRQNWPSIAFPRGQPRGQPMYGQGTPVPRVPQTMAYPPQPHSTGPPNKRAKTQASSSQAAAAVAAGASSGAEADDDEDYTRGDFFDLTTPRDISIARYKQNHEWMEEILSSPYAIHQIVPSDLGLGVRGELHSLTDGIFDAPLNPKKDVVKNSYVGRLDPGKAEMFRQRANEHITETNAEIERMKVKHAKRLAKFKHGSVVTQAEKQLRTAVDNPDDVGHEIWRLEGRIEENEDGKVINKATGKVSDIVAQVEASVGRHAAAVKELIRIQDGGYEEPATVQSPPPIVPTPHVATPASNNGSTHNSLHNGSNGSQHSGVMVGDGDMDMSNSAAGLLDQYHTGGPSSHATPGTGSNFPTPQPQPAYGQAHSNVGTPSNLPTASPQPSQVQVPDTGIVNEQGQSDTTSGDWVVVPPGGVSPTIPASGEQAAEPTTSAILPPLSNPVTSGISITNVPAPSHQSPYHPTTAPTSNVGTPTANTPIPNPTNPNNSSSNINTPVNEEYHASPTDFADLGDIEGAEQFANGGDLGVLGEFVDGDGDVGMNEGMDDSAFGDAFHGLEGGEGEGEEGLDRDGL